MFRFKYFEQEQTTNQSEIQFQCFPHLATEIKTVIYANNEQLVINNFFQTQVKKKEIFEIHLTIIPSMLYNITTIIKEQENFSTAFHEEIMNLNYQEEINSKQSRYDALSIFIYKFNKIEWTASDTYMQNVLYSHKTSFLYLLLQDNRMFEVNYV